MYFIVNKIIYAVCLFSPENIHWELITNWSLSTTPCKVILWNSVVKMSKVFWTFSPHNMLEYYQHGAIPGEVGKQKVGPSEAFDAWTIWPSVGFSWSLRNLLLIWGEKKSRFLCLASGSASQNTEIPWQCSEECADWKNSGGCSFNMQSTRVFLGQSDLTFLRERR